MAVSVHTLESLAECRVCGHRAYVTTQFMFDADSGQSQAQRTAAQAMHHANTQRHEMEHCRFGGPTVH